MYVSHAHISLASSGLIKRSPLWLLAGIGFYGAAAEQLQDIEAELHLLNCYGRSQATLSELETPVREFQDPQS